MKRHNVLPCLLAALGLTTTALASGSIEERDPGAIPLELLNNPTFLQGHPDIRWRARGSRQLHLGNYTAAMRSFTRGAHFADKPSQAVIAEMLWDGTGTARNRPLAYAWMDLAAERGYRTFLLKREAMWQELNENEREQALADGIRLYADYGDDVAKARAYSLMRREKLRHVGSRLGADVYPRRLIGTFDDSRMSATGVLSDSALARAGTMGTTSFSFYDDNYWHAESWWSIQDRQWQGEVIVHPVQDDGGEQP